jgi:hypothetical protein
MRGGNIRVQVEGGPSLMIILYARTWSVNNHGTYCPGGVDRKETGDGL